MELPEQVREAVEFAKRLPGAAQAQAAIDGGVSLTVAQLSRSASVAMEAGAEGRGTGGGVARRTPARSHHTPRAVQL
jgi:hypothetical protein